MVVPKPKGLRLSTKLILTYSLVALIAVVAAGTVALPLLQRYQDDRNEQERQRKAVESSQMLNTLYSLITNRQPDRGNPFRDDLLTNPQAPANSHIWPATPALEVVRKNFSDLAQERNIRI